jgi:DNA-binding NtrC family response regulator
LPKVLLVDDEANVLQGMRMYLQGRYEVVVAVGATLALAELERSGPFAVIVSDFRMPGMDGIVFLSRTRTRAPHAKRILLTGHVDIDVAMSAVNTAGVFRLLTKPCAPEAVVNAISDALRAA